VSSTNDCPFCVGAHAAAARKFDIPESTLQALASDLETAPIDERLKPVLRYVEKLTKTPYQMTQADADAVRAAGWDELALSDAVIGHLGKAPNFGGLSSPARRFRKPPIIAKFIDALGPVVRRSGGRTAAAV